VQVHEHVAIESDCADVFHEQFNGGFVIQDHLRFDRGFSLRDLAVFDQFSRIEARIGVAFEMA